MISPKKVALRYAKLGRTVFPCYEIVEGHCACGKCNRNDKNSGKHPRTKNGAKDASKDPKQIAAWWDQWPTANIAIATGKESNLIVLDVDPKKGGFETLEKLEAEHGSLPQTPYVMTGGGGRHYYFAYISGVKNAVDILPGLDLRSDGGYVICPYSNHLSGGIYEWEAESTLTALPLAPLPEYLLEKTSQKTKKHIDPVKVLAGIEEGKRDDTLFRYACRLRSQGMNHEELSTLVKKAAAACIPKFPIKEAERKIEQAWRYSPPMAALLLGIVNTPPRVEGAETTYQISWGDDSIIADVSQLREHTNGDLTGFVAFTTTLPGLPARIHQAKFNFATSRSRVTLANVLNQRAPIVNTNQWLAIVESLCNTILDYAREGEPCVDLDVENASLESASYLLNPFLLENAPVVFYGTRATGKSYLAQILATLGAVGEERLNLVPKQSLQVLYLSWEDDEAVIGTRVKAICSGLDLSYPSISYRRCFRPLAADVEQVRRAIIKSRANFIVIDSLGPAAGGDLNAAQPAMDFFEALRSLHISNLITAHTAKHSTGTTSIYGNGYFENLARSIWEVMSYQDVGENDLHIGLFHRKSNFSGLSKPRGFKLLFEENRTLIEIEDASAKLRDKLSLPEQIYELLKKESIPQSPKNIAEELTAKDVSVRAALKRMLERGRIIRLEGGSYGLATKDEAPF